MSTIYADPVALFDRALRRVEVSDEGCWLFTGCLNSRGYPCVGAGKSGKTVLGHRLAVIASGRTIPDGMTVDHRCHTRPCPGGVGCLHRRCIRPDHLVVMTGADNSRRRAGELRSPAALPPLSGRVGNPHSEDTFAAALSRAFPA